MMVEEPLGTQVFLEKGVSEMPLRRLFSTICCLVVANLIFELPTAQGQGILRRLGNQIRARRAQMYQSQARQQNPTEQPRTQANRYPQAQIPQYQPGVSRGASPIVVPQPSRDRSKATLGIVVRNFGEEKEGVEVVTIRDHSQAEESGLKLGDLITGVDGKPTPNSVVLASVLSGKAVGQNVRLDVVRDEQRGYLDVPLVAAPTAPAKENTSVAKEDSAKPKGEPLLGVEVETPVGGRGAMVAVVEPGSPAARAGLRVGDRIVSVDGKLVSNSTFLANQIAQRAPGDAMAIQLVRNNQLLASRVTLGSTVALASAQEPTSPGSTDSAPNSDIEKSGKSILEGIGNVLGGLPKPNKAGKPAPKVPVEEYDERLDPTADIFEFGDDEPIDTEVFGPIETDDPRPRDEKASALTTPNGEATANFAASDSKIAELEQEIQRLREELAKSQQ